MVHQALDMFPWLEGEPTLHQDMKSYALKAYKSTDQQFGAAEATAWANGYTIPPSILAKDLKVFRAFAGDFDALVRDRLAAKSSNRLSLARIEDVISLDNPERPLLVQLATVGITVHTAADFVPNCSLQAAGSLPPLSTSYLSASPAVNKCEVT